MRIRIVLEDNNAAGAGSSISCARLDLLIYSVADGAIKRGAPVCAAYDAARALAWEALAVALEDVTENLAKIEDELIDSATADAKKGAK
jgi:hypothetical protein